MHCGVQLSPIFHNAPCGLLGNAPSTLMGDTLRSINSKRKRGPRTITATQNGGMDTDLARVVAALAKISDTELHALIGATYGVPQTAPGLLAWIDGTCDWELNRRAGHHYELLPPEAAIDPSEDELSISAAMVLRDQFAHGSPAVLAFFDALVELLTGSGQKH